MSVEKKEYFALSYFLTRALFLGVGFSYMYRTSQTDTWIAILLGFFLGNIIIYIYDLFSKKIKYNLNNFYNKQNLLSKLYKIIFLLIYTFLFFYSSIIFTNFVKIYYLFDTPIYLTLFTLYIVCYYASKKNEKALMRTAFILLPISLILITTNAALLTPIVNNINFLPILECSINDILLSTIIFAVMSTLPNILLVEYKTDIKTKYKSYAFACFTLFLTNYFITAVLGEYLITTYSYPEYMVLRRIRFLDFIENVENFASIMWYFDSFILITLALCKIEKTIHNKQKKIAIPISLLILSFLGYHLFSNYFSILDQFMKNGILFIIISIILTCLLTFIVPFKKKFKN